MWREMLVGSREGTRGEEKHRGAPEGGFQGLSTPPSIVKADSV